MTLTPEQRARGAHIFAKSELLLATQWLNEVALTARQLLANINGPVDRAKVQGLTTDAARAARHLHELDAVRRTTRLMTGDGE